MFINTYYYRLGYETTKALVKRGGQVVMGCRSLENANKAIDEIRKECHEGTIIPLQLDLASLSSINSFTDEIKRSFQDVDCLIENAGVALPGEHYTDDGFEIHFGVNYLGHFSLVNHLSTLLKNNKSRIVIVSSSKHLTGKVDLENLGKYVAPKGRGNSLYNDSKLMNFYFGRELYKQGFDAHVLCPGLCNTDLFRYHNPKWYHYVLFSPIALWYLRSSEQGAQNIIFAATENVNTPTENPLAGFYVKDLKYQKSKFPFNDQISEELWSKSLELCKITK